MPQLAGIVTATHGHPADKKNQKRKKKKKKKKHRLPEQLLNFNLLQESANCLDLSAQRRELPQIGRLWHLWGDFLFERHSSEFHPPLTPGSRHRDHDDDLWLDKQRCQAGLPLVAQALCLEVRGRSAELRQKL